MNSFITQKLHKVGITIIPILQTKKPRLSENQLARVPNKCGPEHKYSPSSSRVHAFNPRITELSPNILKQESE